MPRTGSISGYSPKQINIKEFRSNRTRDDENKDRGFLSKVERKERRDERRNDKQVSTQPVSPAVPVTTTPVTTPTQPAQSTQPTTPTQSTGDSTVSTLRSAAERYVEIYAKNSGHTFSSTEEKEAKIKEVEEFYGENAQRQDRLVSLVNNFAVA
jgi:hypothetical protein